MPSADKNNWNPFNRFRQASAEKDQQQRILGLHHGFINYLAGQDIIQAPASTLIELARHQADLENRHKNASYKDFHECGNQLGELMEAYLPYGPLVYALANTIPVGDLVAFIKVAHHEYFKKYVFMQTPNLVVLEEPSQSMFSRGLREFMRGNIRTFADEYKLNVQQLDINYGLVDASNGNHVAFVYDTFFDLEHTLTFSTNGIDTMGRYSESAFDLMAVGYNLIHFIPYFNNGELSVVHSFHPASSSSQQVLSACRDKFFQLLNDPTIEFWKSVSSQQIENIFAEVI